ncbi:MAG: glutaminase A [Rickettsiales bacterium]|jgi:glutaminase|nr:glutaminase A [Rickettsiales bacterium]
MKTKKENNSQDPKIANIGEEKSLESDQYNTIFRALSSKGDFIHKSDILSILEKSGIQKKDPRIKDTMRNLTNVSDGEEIGVKKFEEIIHANITLFEKAVNKSFVIPDFELFKDEIKAIYEEVAKNDSGHNADYIPQLARVDPDLFSVVFCSIDGQMVTLGDADENFCAQSTSKAVSYCIALEANGQSKVHSHVGREPSGAKFNEITLNSKNLPHNPMINSGAIMICSLIKPELNLADRFEYITKVWDDLAGEGKVGFDNAVYHSEKETANRNYALAHFMKEVGAFPDGSSIENVLDFYFQCCSIQLSSRQMARVLSTLANGGISPLTNNKIFSSDTVKDCLSMMYSCGMYDFSGEYAFTVGLPAKSGVSGALMIVVPNVGGFAVFSPKLDAHHNSAKGVDFSKRLVDRFNFHNYDSMAGLNKKIDPRKNQLESSSDAILHFIWAASQGDISEARRGISLGIDVNLGDYDKRTALHLAAAEGQYDMVEYLIKKGADVNVLDRWSNSPIVDAQDKDHSKIVKLLLDSGAKKITNTK